MPSKKILLIASAAVIALIFFAYQYLKPETPDYATTIVKRADIVQEISETGQVKKGDELSLDFKSAGKINKVNVVIGQKVRSGDTLAELDFTQLGIQLAQASSELSLNQIKLNKLLNGADVLDISAAQTKMATAQTAYDNAKLAKKDIQAAADNKIAEYYNSALDDLDAAYAKAFNAQNFCDLLQRTYFDPQDPDSIIVGEDLRVIIGETEKIKFVIDIAKASHNNSDIDKALSSAASELSRIASALEDVRRICEKTTWRDAVATADKNTLDSHRDLINASISTINEAKQAIATQKVTNEYNLNAAGSAVDAASGQLELARDGLNSLTAEPRTEDVELLKTAIVQSEAQVRLLQTQIDDAYLKTPVDGEVIAINKKAGEVASALGGGAIVILPSDPFEVSADIYEEDVVKIKIGDPVEISLTAVPDEIFAGSVVSVDPAQKLVNGVVYYRTLISLDGAPEVLKPGMSADVVIITAKRNNVLVITESALQKNETGNFVQVLENGKTRDVPVKIGISSKGQVEIVSGLSGGEEVVIP